MCIINTYRQALTEEFGDEERQLEGGNIAAVTESLLLPGSIIIFEKQKSSLMKLTITNYFSGE